MCWAPAEHSSRALALRREGFARTDAFNQIELARARFLMGEVEQGSVDAETALDLAGRVPASARMRDRLAELATDCARYRDSPAVRDLHTRLTPT